jgi:hypothetical protein
MLTRCGTTQTGRARQEPTRLSHLGVFAYCCASDSCSPTVFRSNSARAFDLLLVLLEADGSLLSKEELLSRVWPGIVVSEENLKVQMSALRKALGADRDVILTEFGRGYRFTGVLRSNSVSGACQRPTRPRLRSGRTLFPQNCRQSPRCSFNSSLAAKGDDLNWQRW